MLYHHPWQDISTRGVQSLDSIMIRKTGPCLWTPVPQEDPAPCDRYKHACCCQGGNIYMLGGRGKTALNDFWKYSVGKLRHAVT